MTMIRQAPHDETERAKWREQANRAAAHMKAVKDWGTAEVFKPMFVFDDGMVELPITVSLIEKLNEQALADWVFDSVLQAQPITGTDGESADGTGATSPSGMKCGHAAPQAQDRNPVNDPPALRGTDQPAAAAVVERCRVKDAEVQCEAQADGGLRLNLYATPTIQKPYGRRVMLSLIFDLPVCRGCVAKLKPEHVTDPEQWKAFAKVAQQRNAGVLVDRAQTEVVLCEWDEPEYVSLRRQIEQRAANDSQPAPAGPQPEGAGDGRT